MIATNIDGSSTNSTSQLFDLLAVVSKPDVYAAKLQALQDAVDKNQALINLIGPATEIATIRVQVDADKKAASQALSDAKINASKVVADAQAKAAAVTQKANDASEALISETSAINAQAKADQAELKKAIAAAKKAQSASDAAAAEAVAKSAALDAAIQAANDTKASYEALKAEVIAKQQKFIASL